MDEEESIREVRDPEEERRGDERDPESVHLAQEVPVELEAELLAPVAHEDRVHEERPGEVADDDADRSFVEHDDEEQRRTDGDEDVREARRDEGDRPLLDAEERRELFVVHARPETDERGHDQLPVVRRAEQPLRDLAREREAEDEAQGRHPHREPERGAQHEPACCGLGRVEVEPEERARDAHAEDDPDDGGERDERLDLPVVGRREVSRVQREQEHSEDPRDEAAEPVDDGVLAQPLELPAERGHQRRA